MMRVASPPSPHRFFGLRLETGAILWASFQIVLSFIALIAFAYVILSDIFHRKTETIEKVWLFILSVIFLNIIVHFFMFLGTRKVSWFWSFLPTCTYFFIPETLLFYNPRIGYSRNNRNRGIDVFSVISVLSQSIQNIFSSIFFFT